MIHVDFVVRQDSATLLRLRKAFRLPHLTNEGHAHQMRTGPDRQPNLESGIPSSLHIPFPFGISGKTRLAVTGVTGRGRSAFGSAADCEPLEQLAIEPHIELLRPPHAHEVILV